MTIEMPNAALGEMKPTMAIDSLRGTAGEIRFAGGPSPLLNSYAVR